MKRILIYVPYVMVSNLSLIFHIAQKGIILSSCGCFFCSPCLQRISSPTPICPNCKKQIDFAKSLDLRVKENFMKINFIFDEPEMHLKKVIESIKFQKMHQKKYINFLENKIETLLKENNSLKQQFIHPSPMTQCPTYDDQLSTINTSTNTNSGYIDLSKIKKIEPKRNKKQSNKAIMNQYTPIEIKHNVNNLNARTASEQFNNQLNMLNVNINNSNKNVGNNIPMSPYKNDYYRDTIKRKAQNLQTPLQEDSNTIKRRTYYNNKYYKY